MSDPIASGKEQDLAFRIYQVIVALLHIARILGWLKSKDKKKE